ncbi:uncharacterized protein LOC113508242 [Trichoplusia ni]|uniref:Uncharacterized protein LOC113508242 n=1 Tax=Trichoplusia ni TaxID=7111 RepID=A0A7E5X2W1_TRINI|nr:uncharacterized protein LOC113508242 [Trichoplusia ni]
MTYIYFMKNKSEALQCFKVDEAKVENLQNRKIKHLRTDNGKEFCNREFAKFLENEGIIHQRTNPYTPQAECRDVVIIEKVPEPQNIVVVEEINNMRSSNLKEERTDSVGEVTLSEDSYLSMDSDPNASTYVPVPSDSVDTTYVSSDAEDSGDVVRTDANAERPKRILGILREQAANAQSLHLHLPRMHYHLQ